MGTYNNTQSIYCGRLGSFPLLGKIGSCLSLVIFLMQVERILPVIGVLRRWMGPSEGHISSGYVTRQSLRRENEALNVGNIRKTRNGR